MKHRLFTLAAAGSLLLCVATVALWVRSYFRCDMLQTTDTQGISSLQTSRGGIGFTFVRGQVNQDDAGWEVRSVSLRQRERPWSTLFELAMSKVELLGSGVAIHGPTGKPPFPNYRYVVVVMPFWLPLLITAILPIARLVARLRSTGLTRAGWCPTCGYDLRATPDRCPECGSLPR